jgi:hypothetical protein
VKSWVVCIFSIGCTGQIAQLSPAAAPPPLAPIEPAATGRPPGYASLHVRCERDSECPAGVALLVGPSSEVGPDGQPNRCTGALVGPDLLITASHCLPLDARHARASCRGTWVAFPAARDADEEWVECDEVEMAEDVDDRAVMRPDVAILRVARFVTRTPLAIDPSPPEPFAIVSIASVTPDRIYRTQHVLGMRLCRVRTTEEAIEIFGADAARVGWLSDCPTYDGNSGSPLLDVRGRIRGILHGGSGPFVGIGVTTPVPSLRSR